MRQNELAKKILKSGGNLTRVIDNLEKNGLVKRTPDPEDRRAFQINLTEKGTELISSIFPQHMDDIYRFFSVLSEKELTTLASFCKKIGIEAGPHTPN